MSANSVEIDIPCDPQQLGEFAVPFALLSEARDPGGIAVGAIVITGVDEDPVFARVHAITEGGDGPWLFISSCCPVIRSTTLDASSRSHLLTA